jgi:hypothetical protein
LPFYKGEDKSFPQNFHLERVLQGNVALTRIYCDLHLTFKGTYEKVMKNLSNPDLFETNFDIHHTTLKEKF